MLQRLRTLRIAVPALAIAALTAGAAVIGDARAMYERHLYISELGAQHMRSAAQFQAGFVLVIAGILLVAVAVRDVRTGLPLLRRWSPSASLVAAASLFLVAAAVPCSQGCPSLLGPEAEPRDWAHIVAAVLAFVAGCVAMLQFATARDRWVARLSTAGGLAVGVIAATGGIISLARGDTDVGSALEFIAAGLGIVWMITVAIVHTLPHRVPQTDPAATAGRDAGAEARPGVRGPSAVLEPSARD